MMFTRSAIRSVATHIQIKQRHIIKTACVPKATFSTVAPSRGLEYVTAAHFARPVGLWLVASAGGALGITMLGGYTRLTESGLSMVDWRPHGRALPQNDQQWEEEFEKYKQHPEYEGVHYDMDLEGFKTIYFNEWLHRMCGRALGCWFVGGFAYFAVRRALRFKFGLQLLGLFALGGAQGLVGWWMVKSGLEPPTTENQTPRVSPYRLATHLCMASLLYMGLLWNSLNLLRPTDLVSHTQVEIIRKVKQIRPFMLALSVIGYTTFVSGAFVAGNDAGYAYNTWPKMLDEWVPAEVLKIGNNLKSVFESTPVVQFNHRILAYFTLLSSVGVYMYARQLGLPMSMRWAIHLLPATYAIQVLLGILTLLTYVPVPLGVLHQGTGMLTLSALVYAMHALRLPIRL